MKHRGHLVEYDRQRADDLRRAFNAYCHSVTTIYPDAMQFVVNMPSARFWVSEERAAIVIADMLRGRSIARMRPSKQEMYREILARTLLLRSQQPSTPLRHLVRQVVNSPAPRFYILPSYAWYIMRKHNKRWREEARKKLQHFLR